MPQARLIFLRHGKIDLPYASHDVMPYRVLVDLANRTLDPHLDFLDATERLEGLKTLVPFDEVDHIFVSPFVRCQDSAKLLAEQTEALTGAQPPIEILELLKETRMDLFSLFAHDLDTPTNIPELNAMIHNEMLHGTHVEPIADSFARIQKLFEKLSTEVGTVICVSHDNIMRVIELFIRSKGAHDPKTVTLDELESTQRNSYLRGFMTDTEFASVEYFK